MSYFELATATVASVIWLFGAGWILKSGAPWAEPPPTDPERRRRWLRWRFRRSRDQHPKDHSFKDRHLN